MRTRRATMRLLTDPNIDVSIYFEDDDPVAITISTQTLSADNLQEIYERIFFEDYAQGYTDTPLDDEVV